jgi:sulfite oxidase
MTPPGKDPRTIVHSEKPLNCEPPLGLLAREARTPTAAVFVRNHGDAPRVDAERFRLKVDGLVETALELSLDDLHSRFRRVEVTAALHCAGNRRAELMRVADIPGETPWGAGAVANARWSGVRLGDVLVAAGVRPGARHVAFRGLDAVEDEGGAGFGGSIPIEKALAPEVLLAVEMNGVPLPAVHGHPLRVVVPGYIGARSVKWLSGVEARPDPSPKHGQRRSYRLLPSDADVNAEPEQGVMLGELAVNTVVCRPADGERVVAGRVAVAGIALAGGARSIARVDLTTDGGASWTEARLLEEEGDWAWRRWEGMVELAPGEREIAARAFDSSANTQPERAASVWNPGGYVNNAWHRVQVAAS